MKNRGELLTKEELGEISKSIFITSHAFQRLALRTHLIGSNILETIDNVANTIKKSEFAYYNTDGSINVAINEFEYFVLAFNEMRQNYTFITFKEKSLNGINIYKKRELAVRGIGR